MAFGIDLDSIKTIVISHGHDDHTKGLKYYFNLPHKNRISILAHPDAFKEKVVGDLKICSPILEEQLKEKCNLMLSKEPIKLSKNITFLGEIPQVKDLKRESLWVNK